MESFYRLSFTQPDEILSMNGRLHWARKASITESWRTAGWVYARRAKVPRLERARIDVMFHFPTARRRDRSNLMATVKCLVDGITTAGVLEDDSDEYLEGPFIEIGPRSTTGRVEVEVLITPLAVQQALL